MAHTTPDASLSGQFKVGGDIEINRLGFGAMRITGPGVWDEPPDRAEAVETLHHLPVLKVNFVDTADSYGPDVSELLIREGLHPHMGGMLIATKGGLLRTGPGGWVPLGRPAYLQQQVRMSLRHLGLERIDLWQLHRIDPTVPRDETFGAIAEMQKEGLIRHVGLSNVTVEEIEAASRHFTVVTVQNRYNLVDRTSEAVLDYCEARNIGFIPWYPLAAGGLARSGSLLDSVAKAHNATPSQIALAWMLKKSPVMLPIPGTGKLAHLEENVAAAAIRLSDDEFRKLDEEGRRAAKGA